MKITRLRLNGAKYFLGSNEGVLGMGYARHPEPLGKILISGYHGNYVLPSLKGRHIPQYLRETHYLEPLGKTVY